MDMTKDLLNRIKKGRKLAAKGMELHETLPRVTDVFTKHAELLFPAEPRPADKVVEKKQPKEWKRKTKKEVRVENKKK